MILLIDNYDSFVYNLARYFEELGHNTVVKRNNEISLEEIKVLNPSHIVLSPGPCTPNETGITLALIAQFAPYIPILGVCLGHQAIGQAYGGKISKAVKPMHGKSDLIKHDGKGIFEGIDNPLQVARYHSLIVESLPDCLQVTAIGQGDGAIMAIAHITYPVIGLQFHPESVLTQSGHALLENFLRLTAPPTTL